MPHQLRDTNIKIFLPSLPTTNPKTSTILKFRTAFSASHHPISTSVPTPRLPIDALHLVQSVHTTPNYPSRFGIIREDRGIGGESRYGFSISQRTAHKNDIHTNTSEMDHLEEGGIW